MDKILQLILKTFIEITNKTKKYGKSIIFFSLLIISTLLLLLYVIFLNNKIMDSYLNQKTKEKEETHTAQVNERRRLNITIYNLLNKFYYDNPEVKNISVLEYHNGSVNLGNKAFLYASTTFEISNDNVMINIQKANLSNYNIFNILYNNNYYCSNLDNLKLIDNQLYYLVKDINGGSYIYVTEIRNINNNNNAIAALFVITSDSLCNTVVEEKTKKIGNTLNYLYS